MEPPRDRAVTSALVKRHIESLKPPLHGLVMNLCGLQVYQSKKARTIARSVILINMSFAFSTQIMRLIEELSEPKLNLSILGDLLFQNLILGFTFFYYICCLRRHAEFRNIQKKISVDFLTLENCGKRDEKELLASYHNAARIMIQAMIALIYLSHIGWVIAPMVVPKILNRLLNTSFESGACAYVTRLIDVDKYLYQVFYYTIFMATILSILAGALCSCSTSLVVHLLAKIRITKMRLDSLVKITINHCGSERDERKKRCLIENAYSALMGFIKSHQDNI
ncbi:hypothetical protein TKK_0005313 [Trichogramma kaykai]